MKGFAVPYDAGKAHGTLTITGPTGIGKVDGPCPSQNPTRGGGWA